MFTLAVYSSVSSWHGKGCVVAIADNSSLPASETWDLSHSKYIDHILKSMGGCCQIGDITRISQLLTEVRQQQSMLSARDPFAGHSNTGVTFCHSILPMLQDLSGELEMQAKDDMFTSLVVL